MTTTNSSDGLSIADVEDVYDTLAEAIDRAGDGKSEVFLVKLALLSAQALGDADLFKQQIHAALRDL